MDLYQLQTLYQITNKNYIAGTSFFKIDVERRLGPFFLNLMVFKIHMIHVKYAKNTTQDYTSSTRMKGSKAECTGHKCHPTTQPYPLYGTAH